MNLEKILVGDDNIEFAKKAMPYIPNADIMYVSSPDDLIKQAKSGSFDLIVTDLNYTPNGCEGYRVLEALKDVSARKILWTSDASREDVRKKAAELGAELLDKDELGSLVGMAVSKAPLKTDGIVLVYAPKGNVAGALKNSIGVTYNPGKIVFSSDLKAELQSNRYGLVIDASTLGRKASEHGTVAHDMKYFDLKEVPKVVCVHNSPTVIADIGKIAAKFYGGQK